MLKKIENKYMGKADYGWLKTNYHFSFADYYNPDNIDFGVLRVLNDDIIAPHTGFDAHPHKDMEIITYVINGELTHQDSQGNKGKITRGNLQYMSAGLGIFHSEHNKSGEELRLLQIWIKPDAANYKPQYGDLFIPFEKRMNKWLKIVTARGQDDAVIQINQKASIWVTCLEKDNRLNFPLPKNKQAYLVQMEGKSRINSLELNERDAMEIVSEEINVTSLKNSHILMIEMEK